MLRAARNECSLAYPEGNKSSRGLASWNIKSPSPPRTRWYEGPCLQRPAGPHSHLSWSQRQISNYKLPPPLLSRQWIPLRPQCDPAGSPDHLPVCFPAAVAAVWPQPHRPSAHRSRGGSASPQFSLQGDQSCFPTCPPRSGSAPRSLTRVLTFRQQGLGDPKSRLSLHRKLTSSSAELSHQNLPSHPELTPPRVFSPTRIVRM